MYRLTIEYLEDRVIWIAQAHGCVAVHEARHGEHYEIKVIENEHEIGVALENNADGRVAYSVKLKRRL
jgi:hypothetical protein